MWHNLLGRGRGDHRWNLEVGRGWGSTQVWGKVGCTSRVSPREEISDLLKPGADDESLGEREIEWGRRCGENAWGAGAEGDRLREGNREQGCRCGRRWEG